MRVMLTKRKGRLNGRWGYSTREKYLAYQQEYNDNRKEAKRARMRELYRERSLSWGQPRTCRDCSTEFEWSHKGRPPVRCPSCRARNAH